MGERGGGGNERVKTKTEWISMKVPDTHAKERRKKHNCDVNKQYMSNNENEKQVMGENE